MANRILRPIIKWVGGKGQLLGDISSRYPAGLGTTIRKYAEPFVGGGAVLFDILSKFALDEVYISDCNAELINMYRKVKTNVQDMVGCLQDLQSKYMELNDDGRKELYYAKRSRYNELIKSGESKDSIEAAVLFIFLNKTCFNGLYRVNGKGLFNVPSGIYKNPLICDKDNLIAVSKALQNVQIVCADYHECDAFADDTTFVYFDPPYRPLTVTANFTSYTENMFNDACQTELARFAIGLSQKGAFVMLSNSDPKNANPDDNFFDDLYAELHINRVHATRMINSNGEGRGKISEILVVSYEEYIPTTEEITCYERL